MTTFKEDATYNNLPNLVSELYRKVSRMERMMESLTPNQDEEGKPMGVAECSQFTGLAIATLYTKVSKDEIPFHKNGKKLYFYKEELTEWIKNGRKIPSPVSALKVRKGAWNA